MHKLKLKFFILFFLGCFFLNSFGQNIPIGTWQDHLPYKDAISVTEGNGLIYCATNSALFTYDLDDHSINRLNLVNGLSDIGLSKIKFNPYNGKLIITYKNGNVDIIDNNNNITNLSFIKNSNVIGSKTINHIFIQGKLAYLSTGFGIVVLDTDKLEIQDTYLIGNLGSYINVSAVTIDTLNIYAATENGIYFADKNDPNLVDYNVWSTVSALGNNSYSNIAYFAEKLIVILERGTLPDSIYYGDNGIWQPLFNQEGFTKNLCLMDDYNLGVVWEWGISFVGVNLGKYAEIYNYTPREIIKSSSNQFWIADIEKSLVKLDNANDNSPELIAPNSPSTSDVFDIDYVNGELWTVSGGYGTVKYDHLINHRSNTEWSNFSKNIDNGNGGYAWDMVSVLINPNNTSNVFVGSWNNGLLEYNNNVLSQFYNAQNSLLDSIFFSSSTAVGAMAFDSDNNLWVTSSFSPSKILAVKTPNNDWYDYSFSGFCSQSAYYPKMIIDDNDYKWIISPDEHKILIFDHNNTLDNKNDDRIVTNNNFPGSTISAITKDQDGEIWIGTDEGVAVFYNPAQVFDDNIEGQQIFIQQEGQTQLLLETEKVTAITVDGANRKWLGTQSSGVYLMSSDGTEEIEHFTVDNSPLFSNTIFDIVIDDVTGEIYIGTAKGLISYKGTATEPQSDFSNIFVYPNPIKPDYEGIIAIRGLVKDTDVRITDISGNIVYETTSLGGQAIWDGNDFNGNRVQSGVYMVFNGSQDGALKAAAKILFIN